MRVNDRGPYAKRRLIDVSERTAELLGFRRRGATRVRVQFVSPAPLGVDDAAMLMASYRGPREGTNLASQNAGAEAGSTEAVAFASEGSAAPSAANNAMQSLTRAYSPADRIFMAFDVSANAPVR